MEFNFSAKHKKSQTLPCALEATSRKRLDFRQKDCWAQTHDKLIDEDPLGIIAFIQSYCIKFACDYDKV